MSTSDSTSFGSSSYTPDEQHRIAKLLERKLAQSEISTRAGAGSKKLSYLEGHKAIELANYTFAFNGWSSSIASIVEDYLTVDTSHRISCGYTAIIRVTLRNGSYHEDVGYGTAINQQDRGTAIEKAKKEAVTDGVKRALRLFGNGLGLCIYDKQYITDVHSGKIKTEALDMTVDNPLQHIQAAPKRVKPEPVTDTTYSAANGNPTNRYGSTATASAALPPQSTYNQPYNASRPTMQQQPPVAAPYQPHPAPYQTSSAHVTSSTMSGSMSANPASPYKSTVPSVTVSSYGSTSTSNYGSSNANRPPSTTYNQPSASTTMPGLSPAKVNHQQSYQPAPYQSNQTQYNQHTAGYQPPPLERAPLTTINNNVPPATVHSTELGKRPYASTNGTGQHQPQQLSYQSAAPYISTNGSKPSNEVQPPSFAVTSTSSYNPQRTHSSSTPAQGNPLTVNQNGLQSTSVGSAPASTYQPPNQRTVTPPTFTHIPISTIGQPYNQPEQGGTTESQQQLIDALNAEGG